MSAGFRRVFLESPLSRCLNSDVSIQGSNYSGSFGSRRVASSEPRADCLPCALVTCFETPYVRSDRASFAARVEELDELDLTACTPAVAAQAAVALHHAYGAIESLLVRVSRYIEGSIPGGPDWHVALLDSMASDLDAMRPKVLSQESSQLLCALLAFRHFFRHAYAVNLHSRRLIELRGSLLSLGPTLAANLDRLDQFLLGVADASIER